MKRKNLLILVGIMLFSMLLGSKATVYATETNYTMQDIVKAEFIPARELFAGFDYVEYGIGANLTMKDGETVYIDLGYDYKYDYDLENGGEKYQLNGLKGDLEESQIISVKAEDGCMDENGVVQKPGIFTANISVSNLEIEYNTSVEIKVVENPVENIETKNSLTRKISLSNLENFMMDDIVRWDLIVNYKDNVSQSIAKYSGDNSGTAYDGYSCSSYIYDSHIYNTDSVGEELKIHLERRHEIEYILNKDINTLEIGETYPLTIRYMGHELETYIEVTENETDYFEDDESESGISWDNVTVNKTEAGAGDIITWNIPVPSEYASYFDLEFTNGESPDTSTYNEETQCYEVSLRVPLYGEEENLNYIVNKYYVKGKWYDLENYEDYTWNNVHASGLTIQSNIKVLGDDVKFVTDSGKLNIIVPVSGSVLRDLGINLYKYNEETKEYEEFPTTYWFVEITEDSRTEDGYSLEFEFISLDNFTSGKYYIQKIYVSGKIGADSFTANPDEYNANYAFTVIDGVAVENCQHPKIEIRNKKSATCKETGYTGDTYCADCGELLAEGEIISKTSDHSYKVIIDKNPTCAETGSQHEECTICGDKKASVIIPSTGHSYGAWTVTEGSCTTGGKKTRTCTKCGKTETETIPAKGHSYGEWKLTKEPTAVAEGVETRTCANCGNTETRTIEKLTPTIKLSASNLPLQLKKSTTVLKVISMQKGDKVASWTSSNAKIVSVNKKTGKLTAKKTGKAIITVKLASGKTAKCTVTVQKGKVATKSIKLSSKKLTLKKGKSAKLTATLNPLTSQDKVTYATSNKKIATVTNKGVVKAKKKGKAKITVKSGKKKTTCTITVK
ncbi:MAG: Ig-like domain-containing protein [Lachnospiraceae bacterium]|nr:Ig-like domain-containing protein [Lachnospiraceae bacterium]